MCVFVWLLCSIQLSIIWIYKSDRKRYGNKTSN